MQFKVGDKVVYPNHGVGIIQEVCRRSIAGTQEEFYTLKIASNNSTVMIPTCNVDHVGLRKLCNQKQLNRLYEVLKDGFAKPNPDWKDRYRDNVEKMKTGSIFEVAEVLKNLHFLSFQKSLSFREKKMFDRARQLVISEIATVKKESANEVENVVEKLLTSSYRRARTGTA